MAVRHLFFWLIIPSLMGVACISPAAARSFQCADNPVLVRSTAEMESIDACRAARQAIAFLSDNGLEVKNQLIINIVEQLPEHVSSEAVGCYDNSSEEIYILTAELCDERFKNSQLFNADPDREFYRSAIAHEIAHAVVWQNYAVESPHWIAQEYVAYVTQLATLPAPQRERILARFGDGGFDNLSQINSITLMLSPGFFAVSAYRHFLKEENGAGFLRRLLGGEVQVNHGLPEQ